MHQNLLKTTYICIRTKHRSMDRPKHGAPMKTNMESGIQEMELSNTDYSQPIQQLGDMDWSIGRINRIISYFSLLLYQDEQILVLYTSTEYNNHPTRKSPRKTPSMATKQAPSAEAIKKTPLYKETITKIHREPK